MGRLPTLAWHALPMEASPRCGATIRPVHERWQSVGEDWPGGPASEPRRDGNKPECRVTACRCGRGRTGRRRRGRGGPRRTGDRGAYSLAAADPAENRANRAGGGNSREWLAVALARRRRDRHLVRAPGTRRRRRRFEWTTSVPRATGRHQHGGAPGNHTDRKLPGRVPPPIVG